MPWKYFIDRQRRLIVSTGSGCLTFDEAKTHDEQLENDPDFDPDFSQIIDFTALTAFDVSTLEAKTLASQSSFSSKSRRALVASRPEIYGMGRLLEVYHEMAGGQAETHIFYDRDEAMKWLGVKE
jgi:hypothetical protein